VKDQYWDQIIMLGWFFSTRTRLQQAWCAIFKFRACCWEM